MQLKNDLTACASRVESFLETLLNDEDTNAAVATIWEAMRYSTLGEAKRIRPYLVLKTSAVLSGSDDVALYFAAALEMVHTYSLIHDDLPCMDNDDYRRGRLSCHKRFGEAEAVLAGDALLTYAFYTISISPANDHQKAIAVRLLAEAAGCTGMIGGQAMDLDAEKKSVSLQTLQRLYDKKTGALMRAAVGLGCISADCYEGDVFDSFNDYARELGLTFQIVDDLLDVYGTEEIGKPVGSDARNGKTTYLSFMTTEEAWDEVRTHTRNAQSAISQFSGTEPLLILADELVNRKK